jgi:hypothetical protein
MPAANALHASRDHSSRDHNSKDHNSRDYNSKGRMPPFAARQTHQDKRSRKDCQAKRAKFQIPALAQLFEWVSYEGQQVHFAKHVPQL